MHPAFLTLKSLPNSLQIEIGLSFRMTSKMLDVNNRMVDLNQSMLEANKQLLQLGNKNFDDNATVKIVTLVTLIYLPASLVSVSKTQDYPDVGVHVNNNPLRSNMSVIF